MNRNARHRQRGLAMAVVLMLLATALLITLSGMGQALVNERVAGNQRQVTEAFMVAEAGLVRAADWWQELDAGQRNDQRYWFDPQGALAALEGLDREPRPGLRWTIRELHFDADSVTMHSAGTVDGTGVAREVGARYRRPGAAQYGFPAPLVFGGGIAEFALVGQGAVAVTPGADVVDVPAVLTATPDDANALQNVLTAEQLDQLSGGVRAIGSEFGLSDPLRLQALVEAVAQLPGISDGPVPWDFGDTGHPAIQLVRGVGGEPADLSIPGKMTGAGILIVTGSLQLEAPPDYSGLIVVLGPTIEIGPGEGTIEGALLLHHVADPAAETWSSGATGSRLQASGSVTFRPGGAPWAAVQGLLSPEARERWIELTGRDEAQESGRLFGWFEMPGL
jgi:hypothetical protein